MIYSKTLIIIRYSIQLREQKYVKIYGFLLVARTFGNKYDKKIIDTATKTGIDVSKTASKKVVHETAEVTGGLTGNKTADRYTSVIVENSKMKYLFKKYTYH